MSNENGLGDKPIQMKLVEFPVSKTLNKNVTSQRTARKQTISLESTALRGAVKDITSQLDHKILKELEATRKELNAARQELHESRNEMANAYKVQAKKNDALLEQNGRYQSTLEKLLPSITDMVINNKNPHVVYGQSEWGKADVVITNGKVPSEVVYAYTAGLLGQFVGINATRMGAILRQFHIYDDPNYHFAFQVGGKSICQKYKLTALKEIFFRKNDAQYSNILKSDERERIGNFLKMKALENAL